MVWATSTCPLVPDRKSLFPEASPDFPVWVRGFLGCLKPALPPTPSPFLSCSRPCCLPFEAVFLGGADSGHLSLVGAPG